MSAREVAQLFYENFKTLLAFKPWDLLKGGHFAHSQCFPVSQEHESPAQI